MTGESEKRELRMDAYYYGFTPTGAEMVDRILSAVACAGKAYHYTESWTEETPAYEPVFRGETPADWIQNAALDAATERDTYRDLAVELVGALGEISDSHIPDQPAASGLDEVSWAHSQYARLRRIAIAALSRAREAGIQP